MSDLSQPKNLVTLEDKYSTTSGRVFLTGIQALVRLPMLQRLRDQAQGLNTAGFVSGYRGSPLGALDLALWNAKPHLDAHHVVFQPGINEDLAATAVWGSQQLNLFPGARYDGVFGLWYGKGPGVDRCGDIFRHANAAGSSRHGGVLVVAGDDHAAKSSTLPHQTEHLFKAVMMPVLYPANVQEYLDLGLHGWAMSRYSGCWVAFKALADTVETSASVLIDPLLPQIRLPEDFALPPDGLNIRWPDPPLQQEARLTHFKLYAALAYARANHLNRVLIDAADSGKSARLGIITAGKSYLDVMQTLDELGIDAQLAAQIGIRLYKVGMVWPLESEGVRQFAAGLEEILVVEEKRQMLEYQLKEELYNWREDVRPRVIGKFDEKGEWSLPHGEWLLPAAGELSVAQIARVIAARIERFFTSSAIKARLAIIEAKQRAGLPPTILLSQSAAAPIQRTPHFCSGCPHNTSTRVPDGSRAVAGIGCHYMATWMNRNTATFSHMGGEGVAWVGQAPFCEDRHIFANLGDGTYFHSGLLAIRQAVAAFNKDVPEAWLSGASDKAGGTTMPPGITYKILYNDAVAMTGGQPLDGTLTVPQLTRQLEAEGVKKMVILTDEPEKYAGVADLAPNVPVRHRDELDAVQRELREIPGVSILIYDQTCATEKRRRRKRGKLADPARRVFINELVCEGCGDCSVQSNCLSVIPVETEFGRKRAIDQSNCNKDYSCLKGFCPSFVTVEGGNLKPGKALAAPRSGESPESATLFADLPPPILPSTAKPFNLLITGVGGTGVITLGAIIGMAAHLDNKGVSVLDMTGLAQKYGAVFSHLRIADTPTDIHAARVATGDADTVLGGDLVVTASTEALAKMLEGRTRVVVNCSETPTAEFTRNPDWLFPLDRMQTAISDAAGKEGCSFLDAQDLAAELMGDALYTNMLLLGFAWQKGMIPIALAAITRAIELNGSTVAANLQAFLWGRRAAHDLEAVQRYAAPPLTQPLHQFSRSLTETVTRRSDFLRAYQNEAYARRYQDRVEQVRQAEADSGCTTSALAEAVARSYFKLLAIKDEYEVARLYTETDFLAQVAAQFEGDYQFHFHLAPPLLAKPDPSSGRISKRQYGPWMLRVLWLLAHLRFLRGSPFDIFAHSEERRLEQALIREYEDDIDLLLRQL
ncbi:MAG TPA: indolepyruvate ferredoxin oxidoreductase family protein, partial [Azospira sp.]|nr:indolepyruvate ferredoxin oxidoreductase family protein [Azospira sp.]